MRRCARVSGSGAGWREGCRAGTGRSRRSNAKLWRPARWNATGNLKSQKSVSPQEMDEVTRRAEAAAAKLEAVRAQTDAARAQESGARTMLGYTRSCAPFAGVVTARMADPGTMAAPGVPLLQIDQAGALATSGCTVDESAIGAIRKGMKVQGLERSTAGRPTSSLAGTVAEIVPAADPASHSFLVKIDLPASNQTARGHVRNGRVCEWRSAGDTHSAFGRCRARFAELCVRSRRPRDRATSHTSRWVRSKADSLKYCQAFPPVKSWSTHPPTANWPGSGLKLAQGSAMKQDLGIAGRLAHIISQFQADAALHRRIAGHRHLCGRGHSSRRRAADPGADAGHHHRHAGRITGRGGRARHAAHRKPGASDLGRRVCVLDFVARAEPGDRAFSGWHAAGRRTDQGLQQALLELRSHAARSFAAADQGPIDRRCSDSGHDAVGRALQRLPIARYRRRDAAQHSRKLPMYRRRRSSAGFRARCA